MDADDELRRIASQDQGEAGANGIAGMTLVYFKALVAGGMTRAEALEMSKVWLASLLARFGQQAREQ